LYQVAPEPETTAGFARLVPRPRDREAYLDRFVRETVDILRQWTNPDGTGLEDHLRRQVRHVNANATWKARAAEWLDWLVTERISRPS